VDYTLAVQMPQYMQLREYLMRCVDSCCYRALTPVLRFPIVVTPLVCHIASCVSACRCAISEVMGMTMANLDKSFPTVELRRFLRVCVLV
jgi:hypothetical protein